MDSDEHPGLGTTVVASFPTQASPSFQSILCLLPPKPLAVSRTCQALPGSLLCTSVPSTPSAIPPLPICEQTALSSQDSAQDSHLRCLLHHPPPQAGLNASSLARSLLPPQVSGSFPSPPLVCEHQEPCLCALELNTMISPRLALHKNIY